MTRALALGTVLGLLAVDPAIAQERATLGVRTLTRRGQVVDAKGAPVAGACLMLGEFGDCVTADILERPVARTAADGTFAIEAKVPEDEWPPPPIAIATPGKAAAWLFLKYDGPATSDHDFGRIVLLDAVTLRGVVRDKDGRPIAGAAVTARDLMDPYGSSSSALFHVAAKALADGSFAIPCALPEAMEVAVDADGYQGSVLKPVNGDEALVVDLVPEVGRKSVEPMAERDEAARPALVITAIDAVTGTRVHAFQASKDRDFRWWNRKLSGPDGSLRLSHYDSSIPTLFVVAEGFAPSILSGIEPPEGWDLPVEAWLIRESAIEGTVVDAATGTPVADAVVTAELLDRTDGPNVFGEEVRTRSYGRHWRPTGSDGKFRVGGMGKGGYRIKVAHPDRPDVPTVEVTLDDQEVKQGVLLKSPAGTRLRVETSGAPVGRGWTARLWNRWAVHHAWPQADGAFLFEGLSQGSYSLELGMPAAPRTGLPFALRVAEDVVVGPAREKHLNVPVREEPPGSLRGRVTLSGAVLQRGRFLVRAINPEANWHMSADGCRQSLVGRDGHYEIETAPGKFRLELVDLATGLVVFSPMTAHSVEWGWATRADLSAVVVPARVRLRTTDGQPILADDLRIETDAEALGDADRPFFPAGTVALVGRPVAVEILLPPGKVRLSAVNHYAEPALGEQEFVARVGEPAQVDLLVSAPPREPPPESRPARGIRPPGIKATAMPIPASRTVVGQVMDHEGAPAAGALVSIWHTAADTLPADFDPADVEALTTAEPVVTADREGKFRFEARTGVVYTLLARQGENLLSPVTCSIAGAAPTLRLGPARRWTGRVTRAAAPVSDAVLTVLVSSREPGRRAPSRVVVPWTTRSGPDGSFAVSIPPQQEFSLRAAHGGLHAELSADALRGREAVAIELPEPETFHGRLVDKENGAAITGATVRWAAGRSSEVRSDADGRFAIPRHRPGESLLVATAYNAVVLTGQAGTQATEPQTIELMQRGGVTLGLRLTHGGQPMTEATVLLRTWVDGLGERGETVDWPVRAGVDGVMTLHGLPARRQITGCVLTGHAFAPFLRHYTRDDADLGDVTVTADQVIEGRVLAPDGQPVPAVVFLQPERTREQQRDYWLGSVMPIRFERTDDQGRFAIAGLMPVRYWIGVRANGHAPVLGRVDAGSAARTLDVQFGPGHLLAAGRLLDPDGKPVAGAWLYARRDERDQDVLWARLEEEVGMDQFWGRSDAQGNFRILGPRRRGTERVVVSAHVDRGQESWSGRITVDAGTQDVELTLKRQ